MINPVAPFYEFLLTIFNSLPSPFRSFFNVCLVVFAIFCVIRLLWSIR